MESAVFNHLNAPPRFGAGPPEVVATKGGIHFMADLLIERFGFIHSVDAIQGHFREFMLPLVDDVFGIRPGEELDVVFNIMFTAGPG